MRVKELAAFARERHSIYERRAAGMPEPWTKDPILQNYRFCNMYRELDRVTIWIKDNWREPNRDNPLVWFPVIIARFLNNIDCLTTIPCLTSWGPRERKQFIRSLEERKAAKLQVWGGAYMVRSDPISKILYLASVLDTLWADRKKISTFFAAAPTLREAYVMLLPYRGLGSFMVAQFIADLKYTALLENARDWWTWAASGPGSRRGLHRLNGGMLILSGHSSARPPKYKVPAGSEADWFEQFSSLYRSICPMIEKLGMQVPHAQDVQGCLCEFDKYERTRLGEGTPRSRYNGTGE